MAAFDHDAWQCALEREDRARERADQDAPVAVLPRLREARPMPAGHTARVYAFPKNNRHARVHPDAAA